LAGEKAASAFRVKFKRFLFGKLLFAVMGKEKTVFKPVFLGQ